MYYDQPRNTVAFNLRDETDLWTLASLLRVLQAEKVEFEVQRSKDMCDKHSIELHIVTVETENNCNEAI